MVLGETLRRPRIPARPIPGLHLPAPEALIRRPRGHDQSVMPRATPAARRVSGSKSADIESLSSERFGRSVAVVQKACGYNMFDEQPSKDRDVGRR